MKRFILFCILIIIIGIFFFYFEPFFEDTLPCLREYDYPTCLHKYINYLIANKSGNCYIEFNESYFPEIYEKRNISVNVYLGNTSLNDKNIVNLFKQINNVWNNYGINFSLNNIDESKTKEYIDMINVDCQISLITERLNKYFNFSDNINIHLVILGLPNVKGGCHINPSYHVITVSTEADNLTWVIIHELGHAIGLCDKALYSGEINMMTHNGCITEKYPTNLGKKQVETILNNQREKCH